MSPLMASSTPTPGSASGSTTPSLKRLPVSSPTFRHTSVRLVDLLPEHVKCFAARLGRSPDPGRSSGLCLVSDSGTPLACGGFEARDDLPFDAAMLFAYFGPGGFWWKKYPQIGMMALDVTMRAARMLHLNHLFLTADPAIEGSQRFAAFIGATYFGGGLYIIDLNMPGYR